MNLTSATAEVVMCFTGGVVAAVCVEGRINSLFSDSAKTETKTATVECLFTSKLVVL